MSLKLSPRYLLLCAALCCAARLGAADWYVATTGNNANAGNMANPFLTIAHAVTTASNGDNIYVAAGTYNEQISVSKQLTFLGPNAGNSAQGSTNRASRAPEAVLQNFILNAACTLDGFSFEGSNSYNGEVAQLQIFVPNCTVKNTIFNGKIDNPFQVSGQYSLGILLGYNTNTGGLMVDGCYFVRFRTGVFANPCDPSATLTFQNSEFSSRTGINFDLGWTKILANISNNLFQVSTADGNPYGPVTALNFGEVTANSVLSIDGNTWETTFVGIDFKAIKTGTTSVSVTNNTFKDYLMVPSTGIFIVAETGTGASISNNFFTCTKGVQNKAGSVSDGNSITNNSFTVAGATAIENLGTGTLPAECNWFGVTNSAAILAQLIGSVDFSPFLLNGTDDDLGTAGFQPASSCAGPDGVPPTALCQNAAVVLDDSGNATLDVSMIDNGSSDNLTATANLVFALSQSAFVCADEGDQSVTLTVTDEEGNTADCMATVTVLDVLYYSESPGLRTAIGGLAQDKLGWGLDLDGGVAIAGAPDDKVGTQNKQGSAFVYLKDLPTANNWGALKQIKASDGLAVEYFGNAVSIDGSTAIVGAYGDNLGALTDCGSAFIFEQNLGGPNNWGERKRISASDASSYAYFANAVSLENGRAIVGASKHKEGLANARGAVYIFEKDNPVANNWGQTQKLLASDGAANNFFGASVGQAGNIALVGANGNLSNRGAVYVFDGNAAWAQTQKLTASDAAVGDGFGTSLAMSSGYAIIGTPNKATYTGAAYVFKNNAGTWSELKKLTASDGATNDRFGTAVDLEGDYAYISALRANGTAGAVYVFHRNAGGPDNWGQIGKYFAAAGAANDQFGYSVAASGDMLAVGANLCDLTGPTRVDAGAVYFFTGEDCPDLPKAPQATFAESRGLAETLSVKCSPNPFRDELAIEINATGAARLTVTDAAGRMMTNLELPAGLGRFTLETSAFRDGMYFVQVSSE
ncbi:MAG: T9SS type A sorting domain-containing protein, partial [Saprospiraceae bacterium]